MTRLTLDRHFIGTPLAGQRISSGGQLLAPAPVMLNDWVYGGLTVIPSNGEYMVIGPDWNNGSQLSERRIGTNLQPIAASLNLPAGTMSVAGKGRTRSATRPVATNSLQPFARDSN